MKMFYSEGIHAIVDGIHILVDPSFTSNKDIDIEELISIRKSNHHNPDYDSVDIILLTHAHSDHSDRLGEFKHTRIPLVCHPMTNTLRQKLIGSFENIHLLLQDEEYEFRSLRITAKEAGHCGGSLMFYVESNEGTILFTGDFNTMPSLSQNPALPIKCDILVMEATFGNPQYTFPLRNEVYGDIATFLKQKRDEGHPAVIMFGQGLGKAQDIVSLIGNIEDFECQIYMDHYSLMETKIFSQYYGDIGNYKSQTEAPFYPDGFTIYFFHMMVNKLEDTIVSTTQRYGMRNPPIVILTGWDSEKIGSIKGSIPNMKFFQISNHSGFNELITFAQQCNPKHVLTFHGAAEDLAAYFRKIGMDANCIHSGIYNFAKE